MEKKEFLTTTIDNSKIKNHIMSTGTTTRDPIADQTLILPIPPKNLIIDTMAPPTDPETNTKIEEATMKRNTEKKIPTNLPTTTKMMAIKEDLKMIEGFRMKESIIGRAQKNVMERKNMIMTGTTEESKAISIAMSQDNIIVAAITIVDVATRKRVTEKTIVKDLQNAMKIVTIEAVVIKKITRKSTKTETTEETSIEEMITESTTGTGKILLITVDK